MLNEWPVFLCYRRVDAHRQAKWLSERLPSESIPLLEDVPAEDAPGEQPLRLKVYFDEETPPGQPWEQIHGDAIRSARALVLISSPGACNVQGPDDWVHKELDWWAKNRSAAPIIVETTGVGERWIPREVREHWRGIQWITITREWLDSSEIAEDERQQVLRQIVAGIAASERSVRNEQIVELERLAERNRRLIIVQWAILAATAGAVALAIRFERSARESASDAESKAQALARVNNSLTDANNRTSRLLKSERIERVKAQYLLALRNQDWDTALALTGPLREIGPAGVSVLVEALSPNYAEQVVFAALQTLLLIGDPSLIEPLLRRSVNLENQLFRTMTLSPPTPETKPYLDLNRKINHQGIHQLLGSIGPEGATKFLDFWANLRFLPRNDPIFDGPGLERLRYATSGHLARMGEKVVPRLLGALERPGARSVAARALGILGPAAKEATPRLIALLTQEDKDLRREAAIAIAGIGPRPEDMDRVLAILAENLDDPDALHAIARLGPPAGRLAEPIAKSLMERDPLRPGAWKSQGHLEASIRALGALDTENDLVARALIVHLSTGYDVQLAAIEAMGRFRSHPELVIPALIEQLGATYQNARVAAVASLGALGRSSGMVADKIVKQLAAREPRKKQYLEEYLEAIAAIGPNARAAEGELTSLIEGQEAAGVRTKALWALGRVADYRESTWNLVVGHMSREGPGLRNAAQDALNAFAARHPEAARRLGDLMRSDAKTALEIVGRGDIEIRDDRLRQSLLWVASDADRAPGLRKEAVEALGGVHEAPEVTARSLLALPGDDAGLSRARVSALTKLARRSDTVVALIAEELRQRPDRSLISTLGKVGPRAAPATPVLIGILRRQEDLRTSVLTTLKEIGPAARLAEAELAQILRTGSDLERDGAVAAIGRIGVTSARTVAALLELLERDGASLEERSRAGAALRALDDQGVELGAIARLIEFLGQGDWVVRKYVMTALILVGRPAHEAVAERLRDDDLLVRQDAFQVLAASLSIPKKHLLIPTLSHADPDVQRLAVRALARTGADGPRVADAIAEVLESGTSAVRIEALKAIRELRLDSPKLRRAIAEAARSNEADVSQWAKEIQLSAD
jgi:HEAT repeat protein